MLLPEPTRRGEVQFWLAKKLPYETRLWTIGGLLALGFLVQALLDVWLGAVPLLAASLLSIVKGFSNVPEVRGRRREWRGAEKEQLRSILDLARRSRRWDQTALDVTCALGLTVFIVMVACVASVAVILYGAGEEWLARAWTVDAAVLLLPHWLTGVRRILKSDPLEVKVRQLLHVWDHWERLPAEGETMLAQMEVRIGEGGEMPTDAKLILRMESLGELFLGIQVQVVLNRVQGKDYPYLYCVLVARTELGMLGKLAPLPPKGVVLEEKRDDDVDILVVRNRTTKRSGYHTRPRKSQQLFDFALHEARWLADYLTA